MTKGNIFPTDLWPVTSSRVQGNQQAISFIQLSIIWTFFTGFSLRQFGRIKVTVSIYCVDFPSVGRSVGALDKSAYDEWFHREEPDYLRPLSKMKQNKQIPEYYTIILAKIGQTEPNWPKLFSSIIPTRQCTSNKAVCKKKKNWINDSVVNSNV